MSLEFTLHSIARSIFTDELLDSFLAEDQKPLTSGTPSCRTRSIRKESRPGRGPHPRPSRQADRHGGPSPGRLAGLIGIFRVQRPLHRLPKGPHRWVRPGPLSLLRRPRRPGQPSVVPRLFKKHQEAENLFRLLRGDLPEPARTLLADVEIVWSDRVYGVALQGFRFGLLGALRALTVLGPKEVSQDKLLPCSGRRRICLSPAHKRRRRGLPIPRRPCPAKNHGGIC